MTALPIIPPVSAKDVEAAWRAYFAAIAAIRATHDVTPRGEG